MAKRTRTRSRNNFVLRKQATKRQSSKGQVKFGNLFTRGRLRIASCALILLGIGYVFFWFLKPAHFPVSAVKVYGENRYLPEEEIYAVVNPHLAAGFFGLKVSNLQQQLLSLPWVRQTDVRRIWPGELVIRIQEHEPAAFWGQLGVISKQASLFFPDRGKMNNQLVLPVLSGPDDQYEKVWQQFLVMKEILSPINLDITSLTLAQRGAWQLTISNGFTIILGTNDVISRLNRFVKAYKARFNKMESKIDYIDLRYTTGIAIGWKSG